MLVMVYKSDFEKYLEIKKLAKNESQADRIRRAAKFKKKLYRACEQNYERLLNHFNLNEDSKND